MTRVEFIRELDELLNGLPDKERLDILADYTEHFLIGMDKGKSEHEIAEALGSPKMIAKEIIAGYHIHQAQSDTSIKNVTRALFATVSLGFFNLLFVLGPFFGLIGILLGLYAASVALILSPVGLFISYGVPGNADETLFFVSASLASGGLGVMMGIGMIALTKWLYRQFLRYLNFNLRMIRGK
ncbi:DUF1700 domain-containing protein [Brevibacillus sp. H7]|uniref:DUF1700 domain-containing protein n=1 Tax=Brevibacillus sp. H7 TaxID=3349138 RepID=UPI00381B76DD